MTTTPSPATASTPPLIQRLAAGDCLWVIVTDTEVQSLLRAGHAYIAATLPHRSEMVTLAITDEGRVASEMQREFFRDLDDAEQARDVQATREAVERIKAHEAESIAFLAADEFIKATNDLGAFAGRMSAKPSHRRWYSKAPPDGDMGGACVVEVHRTAEAARRAVLAVLEDGSEGWPEDVEAVEWGELVPMAKAQEYNREETPEGEFDYMCEYRLAPVVPSIWPRCLTWTDEHFALTPQLRRHLPASLPYPKITPA